jgi:uncharacterized protein (DUF2345 family)
MTCSTSDGSIVVSDCSFRGDPASSGIAHTGSISLVAVNATLNNVDLSGISFEWAGTSSEFSLFVNNLAISDVLVTSSVDGFSCRLSPAMIVGLAVTSSYREAGTIIDLGTTITSRASDVLVDVCEVQFTVGVPSIFCAGGESYLNGIVISNLTMPLPTSTDVHVRVPHLLGLLYDGSEIISVDAEDIFGSVGIGTSSGAGADGITAVSADNTLLASSSGTDIDVSPIAVGSGYVLGGSTVFGPIAPASLALLGDPAFVDRGLLQIYANGIAEVLAAYIVQKVPNSVEPLDLGFAEIVDISEGHITTASGFVLAFDGSALSWASGEPVTAVLGETYRLFCSDYSGWIDVKVASAPGASGSDTYKVFASKKNNGGLLLGHAFWDGSSSLSAVEDKRYFGNFSGSELTDATNASLISPVDDLRTSMIYTGGEVIAGISVGLGNTVVRIIGPVIAYVAGRRFEVPLSFGGESVIIAAGGYAGITLLGPSSVNYLYVDAAGVFQVGSAWPADDHARIAEVTVAGVVSAIVDSRRATVGLTSIDSLEWEAGTKTLSILSSGSTAGTTLSAETLEATTLNTSEVICPTGPLLVKSNSGDVLVTAAGVGDVTLSATGTGGMSLFVGGAAPVPAAGDMSIGTQNGSGGISVFAGGTPPNPGTSELLLGAALDIRLTATDDIVLTAADDIILTATDDIILTATGGVNNDITLTADRAIVLAAADAVVVTGANGIVLFAGPGAAPASATDDLILKATSDVVMTGDLTVSMLGLTGNHTTNIATQATTAASQKIVRIGTGSVAGSETFVTLGGATGGAGSFLHGYNGDNGESLSLPSAFERRASNITIAPAAGPPSAVTTIFQRRLPPGEFRVRAVLWMTCSEPSATIDIGLGNLGLNNWPLIAIRLENALGSAPKTNAVAPGDRAEVVFNVTNGSTFQSVVLEGSITTDSVTPLVLYAWRAPGDPGTVQVLTGSYLEIIGF